MPFPKPRSGSSRVFVRRRAVPPETICKRGAVMIQLVGFLLALVHSLESPGELAAKRLAWELETRKSVELRTRTDITSTKADPQRPADFDAIEDHYVENAAGQRKCDSRHFKSDAAVGRYEHFSDGMRCADVNFSKNDLDKQESIIFKRQYWMEDRSERRECPQPLRFLYVGREPIHKALPSAGLPRRGPSAQIAHATCSCLLRCDGRFLRIMFTILIKQRRSP